MSMIAESMHRDWTKALARARKLMPNRTHFRRTYTDPLYGTESLVIVESATAEGTEYAVRVIEQNGVKRIKCTCPAHEHGVVCWHKASALIMLGMVPLDEAA